MMCNDLCGFEFNMKVSALKSKGGKKLHWHSVLADNLAIGTVFPSENATETICQLLPITFLSVPVAGRALPSACENPGCWLQWYLQR